MNISDLQHTWDRILQQPKSPEGFVTIRITEEQRQQIRQQLGIFEITFGNIRMPVVIDSELPSGAIILRSHSPYQDIQINLVV